MPTAPPLQLVAAACWQQQHSHPPRHIFARLLIFIMIRSTAVSSALRHAVASAGCGLAAATVTTVSCERRG
eukprot:COSAG06_NODE_25465_length_636_cov_0.897579_1_plen_70_part_01